MQPGHPSPVTSERIEQSEAPLAATAAFIRYLAHAHTMREFVPFPLEMRTPLLGRTTAGYFIGQFEDAGGRAWCEWFCISAAVRYGKRRGYFISNHFTNSPEVFRNARDSYGLETLTGVMKSDLSSGGLILHNNAGARFMARAHVRPLLPSPGSARRLNFFTFRDHRLHEFQVTFEAQPFAGLSRLHVDRAGLSFPKPLVKLPTLMWRRSSLTFTSPADIDLRGFHPKPVEEVRVG